MSTASVLIQLVQILSAAGILTTSMASECRGRIRAQYGESFSVSPTLSGQ